MAVKTHQVVRSAATFNGYSVMLSRKWWKRIILGVAITITLSLIGTIIEWESTRSRGEQLRDTATAQLDRDDPNWRTVDLTTLRNVNLPPGDSNAAERAMKAYTLLPASYLEWRKDDKWQAELKPGELPHESDLCTAVAVYAECEEATVLARSLRDHPRGGFALVFKEPDLIGTPLTGTQNLREIAGFLDCDVTILASLNQPDEAIRSCHALLNLARGGIGDEPTLISQLVRHAITFISVSATQRTLGLGEPRVGLAELQADYLQELRVPRLTYGLRGERAMMFRLLENIDNGSLSPSAMVGTPNNPLVDRLTMPYLRKHIPAQQAQMIEMFNGYIAADKVTGPERRAAIAAVQLPPRRADTMFVYLLMPALEKCSLAEARIQAQLATGAVGLACERYRQKFGKWPESLAAISKDLLSTLPVDPYTGNALLYAKFEDGVAVYTTGEDLIDDKGVELNSSGKGGTDLGFRLFNPAQRRREPLPKAIEPTDPFEPGEPPRDR